MNNSIKLLERVRERTPNKSKNQVAQAIGSDQSNVRRIYRGRGYPNPIHCMEIAKILGMDATEVITYVQADKAKSDEAKEAVRVKLPRLPPTIALALAGIVGTGILIHGGNATAEEMRNIEGNACPRYTLCEVAMKTLRKLLSLINDSVKCLPTGLHPVPA